MLIKMKKTTPVSTTGLNNLTWIKGEIHDAPEDLAENLVRGGLASIETEHITLEEAKEVEVEVEVEAKEEVEELEEVEERNSNSDNIIEIDE